jgi:hypothetical protein
MSAASSELGERTTMLRMSGGGVMTPIAAVCEATEAGFTTGSPVERSWSAPSPAAGAVVTNSIASTQRPVRSEQSYPSKGSANALSSPPRHGEPSAPPAP